MDQTCESMDKKPDIRRKCRTSGQRTAKSVSIKGAKRRSGDCAWKAAELTPGDLFCVALATEAVERQLIAGQKSAEGILGHVCRQG
jgi:hypothetical protein